MTWSAAAAAVGSVLDQTQSNTTTTSDWTQTGRYSWLPNTEADVGLTGKWGGADYIQALREGGVMNLARTRELVLDWLRGDGGQYLSGGNVPGAQNENIHPITGEPVIGLFDRIEGAGSPNRDLNTNWGDHTVEGEKLFFTEADLMASRALLYPDEQIRDHLSRNMGWLRGGEADPVWQELNPSTAPAPGSNPTPSPVITRNRWQTDIGKPGYDPINQEDRTQINPQLPKGVSSKGARSPSLPSRNIKYKQTTDLSRESRNSLNIS